MALKRRTPKTQGGGNKKEYEMLPDGEYEARLVYVADLGLQEREYMGEKKDPTQQLALGLEILGHPVQIDGVDVPRILWTRPFNIFMTMTEKGNEFAMYRVFDTAARAGEEADWEAVLGTPCNVVVGTRVSGDRSFDNIEAITPIPTKYRDSVPEGELEPAVGDADDESNPATAALFGLVKYVYDKRLEEVNDAF